ncbi:TPA: hypothetical protein UM793_000776 [Stenotrophomonas maltophilia]|nr:hypothetical protein [Stenotrophomonas maltophilia]
MFRVCFLILPAFLWGGGVAEAAPLPTRDAYIEFLWTKTPEGALARQETRSFALDGQFDHQVCFAILNADIEVKSIELRAMDADGKQLVSTRFNDADGRKRCVPVEFPAGAPAGKWTYQVRVNGQDHVVGSQTVDVFPTVDALISDIAPDMPYVLGRPNYDSSIAPDQFNGELEWIMHIRRDGTVSAVDIDRAEGAGIAMRPRAVEAGLISLFPPDEGREPSATFKRHLSFRPDK